MSIERIALVLLALIAIVMGANYVTAAGRFLDANRAYDGLTLTLEEFSYTDAASPVYIELTVENPTASDIDVLVLNMTLRAGLQSVGGEEIRINETLSAGESRTYRVEAGIADQNVVNRIETDEINWLIRGEIQVQLDEDLSPVWIQFSVRTITS